MATMTSAAMPKILPRCAVGELSPIMAANIAAPNTPTETQIVVQKSGSNACGGVMRYKRAKVAIAIPQTPTT